MKKILLLVVVLFGVSVVYIGPTTAAQWLNQGSEQKIVYKTILAKELQGRGLSEEETDKILNDPRIRFYPEILSLRLKKIDYFDPKFELFTPESIERGRKILKEQSEILARAEKEFRVSKEIVVSIFRIETNCGCFLGNFTIFNSLHTLYLFSKKSAWAKKELVDLIWLCRQNKWDPFTIRGSFAGAFGLMQFMPSSYLAYAVSAKGDGQPPDMFCFDDAIFSAANYLKCHGWQEKDQARIERVLLVYACGGTHCQNYVRAVLAYARAIGWKR